MSDDAGRELARIQKWNLVVLALAIGGAAWKFGRFEAGSLALGGTLGAANFWLTAQVVRRMFAEQASSGLVGVKFVVFFGAVGGSLWLLRPDGTGFAVGFCSVLVAIVATAIVDLAKQEPDAVEEESKGPDDRSL